MMRRVQGKAALETKRAFVRRHATNSTASGDARSSEGHYLPLGAPSPAVSPQTLRIVGQELGLFSEGDSTGNRTVSKRRLIAGVEEIVVEACRQLGIVSPDAEGWEGSSGEGGVEGRSTALQRALAAVCDELEC